MKLNFPTIFLFALVFAAGGIIAWHFKPSTPAPPLYHGTATVTQEDTTDHLAEMMADTSGRIIYWPPTKNEVWDAFGWVKIDSTIKPFPFKDSTDTHIVEGVCFGIKVDQVLITRVKMMGTADVTVTPQGDIVVKPITPGLSMSFDPGKVNLHKNRISAWIMGGAQVIPPYKPLLAVGLEWRGLQLGATWLADAPGIVLGKRW